MSYIDMADTEANAMLDAMTSLNSGTLELRTGAAPGIGSADSGTLLATLVLNATAFAAAASRARVANAISDVVAAASGTIGHARAKTSGGTRKWDIKAGGSWITVFSSSAGLLGTTNVTHGLSAGDQVEVFVEGAGVLPTGLAANTTYYVISPSGATLKLSLTEGGAAIAFTDAGTQTIRLKLAANGLALQSADGTIAAGITVGIASLSLRIPNVTL